VEDESVGDNKSKNAKHEKMNFAKTAQRALTRFAFVFTLSGQLPYTFLVCGEIIPPLGCSWRKMAKEKKYEGWENRETWLVSLHLENDEPSCRYWLSQAEQCQQAAPHVEQVGNGIWMVKQAVQFVMANQLEEQLSELAIQNSEGLYGDLLLTALGRVNWEEIAEHWLVKE